MKAKDIDIKKVHSTKRIFHFMITINDKTWISRDNYFIRKKLNKIV